MPVESIDVPTPDGAADAYLARPDGDGRYPGVLFVMDAIGLRPQIAAMAQRIADAGYVVLAPNAFYRAGRATGVAETDFSRLRPLIAALGAAEAASDGRAYLDYLDGVADGPHGATGYCMGARFAVRVAAAEGDRVAAVGGFHGGGFVTDEPDSPHTAVGSVTAELYFGHADNDGSNPAEAIAAFNAALDAAGITYRADVYAGAAHGYTMADTPAYDEAAAERHFDELLALFGRTLGG